VLLWFAKAKGRTWMMRLFIAGFCVLLVWAFIRLASRLI
jgi:hypothetical protein